jgi:hypothetical protein
LDDAARLVAKENRMRFLVFDGEVINVGSIQEINFEEPPAAEDVASESHPSDHLPATEDRSHRRTPFAGSHHDPSAATLPRDRARILVLGRSEPLETSDPQRIARLRELWRAKRAVGA